MHILHISPPSQSRVCLIALTTSFLSSFLHFLHHLHLHQGRNVRGKNTDSISVFFLSFSLTMTEKKYYLVLLLTQSKEVGEKRSKLDIFVQQQQLENREPTFRVDQQISPHAEAIAVLQCVSFRLPQFSLVI